MSNVAGGGSVIGGPPLIGAPVWVLPGGFQIDMDFANNRYFGNAGVSALTVSRASGGTDLTPTSASGASFQTFGNNIARVTAGSGLLVEEQRINELVNSTAPVTQTTASLSTGTYTLWVNGAGSATSSAGTATITGGGTATQGTPNSFFVEVAGTVTVTVAGALNLFQCERNPGSISTPTSLIVSGASRTTRAADVVTLTSPPVFGAAYTLYAAATPAAPTTFASNQFAAAVSDGSTTNQLALLRVFSSAAFRGISTSGGVQTALDSGGNWSQNTLAKLAVSTTPMNAYANGSALGTQQSPTLPVAVNSVHIGASGAGNANFINGFVSRIAIAPSVAVAATLLQQITS